MLDPATGDALYRIEWNIKGDEWLGKPTTQIDDWETVVHIMGSLRCPWRQSRKRFVAHISLDPETLIDIAIKSGHVPDLHANDYFPTPPTGATELVNAIPDSLFIERVLEPSAGTGAIVTAIKARWPAAHITAIETDPLNLTILGHLHPDIKIVQADFLTWRPTEPFDACVMNPPFTANGGYKAHIPHALGMLRTDCYLATLNTSGAITYNEQNQPWRAFLARHQAEIWRFKHDFADTDVAIDAYLLQNTKWQWRYATPPHLAQPAAMLGLYIGCDQKTYKMKERWGKNLHRHHFYPENRLGEFIDIVTYIQKRSGLRDTPATDIWDIDPWDHDLMVELANEHYLDYLINTKELNEEEAATYMPPPKTLIPLPSKPKTKPLTKQPQPTPTKTRLEPIPQGAFF